MANQVKVTTKQIINVLFEGHEKNMTKYWKDHYSDIEFESVNGDFYECQEYGIAFTSESLVNDMYDVFCYFNVLDTDNIILKLNDEIGQLYVNGELIAYDLNGGPHWFKYIYHLFGGTLYKL